MNIKGFTDTIKWYDKNAENYSKAGASFFDLEHITAFASRLTRQAKILDAGCGSGRDANLLYQYGLDVTGIDISKGLLEVARKHFPKLHFIEGDMRSLPIPDATFSGVWANTSLLHFESIPDVEKALSEFHRVLKPSGYLHVLVKAQTSEQKTAIVTDKLSKHERFFRYFSSEELQALLKDAGFDIVLAKQYSEQDRIPNGRAEVDLIWILSKKSE